MNAGAVGKVLKAIPTPVYLAAGGALVLYLIGRRVLDNLTQGGTVGVGQAIGQGIASLVGGVATGTAQAAGGITSAVVEGGANVVGKGAAAVIKAPGQVVDSALFALTGSEDISLRRLGEKLGEGLFNFFNKPYDPNVPNTPALRRVAQATSPVRPQDKVTAYAR